MVFIHYLLYGLYPPTQGEGYDTEQCIKALLKLNIDQNDEEPPDLRRLLSGPAHLMISILKTNYRAKRLYGASVDGACQGIHRLMISGVFQEERRGRQSVWRFVSYAQYSGSIKAHNDTAAQIQFCNDPRPYVTHCRSCRTGCH